MRKKKEENMKELEKEGLVFLLSVIAANRMYELESGRK
jgi:hypothetical protein